MQLYAIKNMMIETLDIFLGSEQDSIYKDFYNETMEFLKEELLHKSSNIIKYIANLDAEAQGMKQEIERLTKAKKSRECKLNSLKNYLVSTMQHLEKTKIETDLGSYGLRKSTSLKVLDMDKIPEEYLRVKQEVSVDKRELKNYIKAGKEIEGVALVENYSLQIK